MSDELIIDGSNFDQYFTETSKGGPKRGQVLARYTAMADFVDGDVKRYIAETLRSNPKGAEMASQVMKYHCHATDEYSSSIPLEMAKDLDSGMTKQEVLDKPYRFQIEYFYWVEREYVPDDDCHWEIISISKAEWEQAYKDIDDMEKKEKEADNDIPTEDVSLEKSG